MLVIDFSMPRSTWHFGRGVLPYMAISSAPASRNRCSDATHSSTDPIAQLSIMYSSGGTSFAGPEQLVAVIEPVGHFQVGGQLAVRSQLVDDLVVPAVLIDQRLTVAGILQVADGFPCANERVSVS